MKKVVKFIFCLILIITNITIFVPNKVDAICNTIRFSKEVSAINLTLADGTVLYDLAVSKNATPDVSTLTPTNYKNLNLIFIIDTKTGLTEKKNAVNGFIDKVYSDLYPTAPDKIKMGVIPFNDLSDTEIAGRSSVPDATQNVWKSSKDDIKNSVNNLQASSNQTLEDALTIAYNNMEPNDGSRNNELVQEIVIISNGINNSNICVNSNTLLKDLGERMIAMYGIFIDVPEDNSNIKNLTKEIYELKIAYLSLSNVQTQLEFAVLEYIKQYMVNESTIIPKVNKTSMVTNNSITLFVDEELIYGATLKIEYVFTTSRVALYGSGDIYENTIRDEKDAKLVFRANEKLITDSSKTNSDYGWQDAGNGLMTRVTDNEIKLVLSTVITPEMMKDAIFSNSATCYTSFDVGSGASARYTLSDKAIDVIVMPPFGKEQTNIERNMPIIIGVIVGIVFFTVIFVIIRKRRKNK